MRYYSEIVPFEIAVSLDNEFDPGIGDGYCYAVRDIKRQPRDIKAGELVFVVTDEEDDLAAYVQAPTYAEVVDFFLDKGIFIEVSPWHTFALKERMGFVYTINTINEEEAKLDCEVWNDFASFKLCMNSAIKRALQVYRMSKCNE